MKDAFIDDDGAQVPLVWNHQHNDPHNVLGHAKLKNMDEGVYAYCKFNDSESGKMGREMVRNGDVNQLSIYANKLKQKGGNVLHGAIREVSLVLAGANPGAYITNVLCHSADSDDEAVIFTGEDIELAHSEENVSEEEEVLAHASGDKKADNGEGNKKEDKPDMAETKEQVKDEKQPETKTEEPKEKTVKDVFDTFTEEQKTVVYALISQALEDAGAADDDADEDKEEKEVKHSEGGNEIMHTNVFVPESTQQVNVLTHADQEAILELAKKPGVGSFQHALAMYIEDNKDTLSHGIVDEEGADAIGSLFPEFKDVKPGAPELLERDMDWVAQVMKKAHKAPYSRVRTRQIDARATELRGKGYKNREEEKALSGNLKLLSRTTDPQTVYYRDNIHRDDITDITDFDIVAYQKNVMKHGLEEVIALAALVGDGRGDTDPDKISTDHIRPVWTDADLYTIKAEVDVDAMAKELQGTDTTAHFGESFIFSEAVVTASLYAREKCKAKGALDFYCAPHTLNKMLLARDMNGRRIYDSAADIAKVLNVANIYTVEQMDGLTREDAEGKTKELLGLFVNMASYQFGSTKGGEITSFEQFDIDFNNYKYLMEARLSGALVDVYSAIALEMPKAAAGE
jgi:hypothetical protein